MHNRYFILRHGQSQPNIAEMILSDLEEGKKEEWTLTLEGEKQVEKSVTKAKDEGVLGAETIIYSSPFSRAKRTAKIVKEILRVESEIIFDERLRERWFGEWEKTHNSNYQKVWDVDKDNPEHKEKNVESAKAVQERVMSLIKDLEEKYKNQKILLVSHGDALQIMQTGFMKICPSKHREVKHLETAEIRELK